MELVYLRIVVDEVVVERAGPRQAQLAVGIGVSDEQARAERRLALAPPLQPVVLVAHELAYTGVARALLLCTSSNTNQY